MHSTHRPRRRALHALLPLLGALALLPLGGCGEEGRRGGPERPDRDYLPPIPPPPSAGLGVNASQSAAMGYRVVNGGSSSAVELALARDGAPGQNDLIVTLCRATPEGAPNLSQTLGSTTFSSSGVGAEFGVVRVELTSQAPLNTGDRVAVVLRATGSASVTWGGSPTDGDPSASASMAPSLAGPWQPVSPASPASQPRNLPPAIELGLKTYTLAP